MMFLNTNLLAGITRYVWTRGHKATMSLIRQIIKVPYYVVSIFFSRKITIALGRDLDPIVVGEAASKGWSGGQSSPDILFPLQALQQRCLQDRRISHFSFESYPETLAAQGCHLKLFWSGEKHWKEILSTAYSTNHQVTYSNLLIQSFSETSPINI